MLRVTELQRIAGHRCTAAEVICDIHSHATSTHLGVVEHLRDTEHTAGDDARRHELVLPLFGRAGDQHFLENCHDLVAMGVPGQLGAEAGIVDHVGAIHDSACCGPHALTDAQRNPAVTAFEVSERHCALATFERRGIWLLPESECLGHAVGVQCQHHVEHRDIDVLTGAGAVAVDDGGENAYGAEDPGEEISDRDAPANRWAGGIEFCVVHGARQRLDDRVIGRHGRPWSVATESGE